jgi:hypothetical protein
MHLKREGTLFQVSFHKTKGFVDRETRRGLLVDRRVGLNLRQYCVNTALILRRLCVKSRQLCVDTCIKCVLSQNNSWKQVAFWAVDPYRTRVGISGIRISKRDRPLQKQQPLPNGQEALHAGDSETHKPPVRYAYERVHHESAAPESIAQHCICCFPETIHYKEYGPLFSSEQGGDSSLPRNLPSQFCRPVRFRFVR